MTRSNGPHDQAPQWRQPTRAAYDQTGDGQQPNWQYSEQDLDPNQVFQAQPPQPGQPAAPGGYPGTHDPGYAQNFGQPHGDPAASQPYDQYQPGYDPAYQQHAGAGHAPYQQPDFAPQSYGAPGGHPAQHGDPNASRGYGDQYAAPHMRNAAHDPAYDNSAYDLGNYMPAQTGPGLDEAHTPGFGEPGYRPGQNWDFGTPNSNNPLGGELHQDQPGFGQAFDNRHQGAITEHGDAYGDEHDDDYDYEYDDEDSGSGRKWLIAGSLVAAIVVGGGVAYGYNVLFTPPSGGSGAPIVKAESGPAKVPPANPGGRKFDHTNSKLLGKLGGSEGGATGTSSGTGEGSRVRSVSTVAIGPDGRLIIPEAPKSEGAAAAAPAGEQAPDSPGLPGMTIVGAPPPAPAPQASAAPAERPSALGASGVTPAPVQPAPAPPPVTPKAEAAPVRTAGRRSKFPPLPVRSGLARPAQAAPITASVAPSSVASANVASANVTPVVVPQARQAAPQAAPRPAPRAPAAASAAPNGFVAVLSTKRSRIDALTSFADMQQKYASILGGKIPAVRRADLSARGLGVMYRAGVGPPGSRQAAGQTCARLKAAGYSGCWVAPY